MEFKNRVYGVAIVKAINSNYNADFSGQPRRLPNGKVYATDKAFKYTVKNYIKDIFNKEKVLYFKRFDPNKPDFIPYSLVEGFCAMFPELAEVKVANTKNKKVADDESDENIKDKVTVILKADKKEVGKALLECLDIRLFGATFAMKGSAKKDNVAISLHGPVQVNHGVNIWHENNIFTEQIISPFRNPSDDNKEDKQATTIGRQSKLEEGHYVHHFSINPQNLSDIVILAGADAKKLSTEDIEKLKEGMRRGVTWYDSASKAGCENEILFWVQLNEDSKIVFPNFTTLINTLETKQNGKVVFDFQKAKDVLAKNSKEIEKIEIYYNKSTTAVQNLPEHTVENDL